MSDNPEDSLYESLATAALIERDRYKAGNTALLEALMDMVYQHCLINGSITDVCAHGYLSANENAFRVLEEAGMAYQSGGGLILDWTALESRKPKRQTFEEAVRECVTDPAEIARLLALDEDTQ